MNLNNLLAPEFIITAISALALVLILIFVVLDYKSKHQKPKVAAVPKEKIKKSDVLKSMLKEKEDLLNKERKLYVRIQLEKEVSKLEKKYQKQVKKEEK